MLALRKRGGICQVEVLDIPTFTYWDIGNSDGTAIWFHQMMNQQDRYIDYEEAHGEDLRYYAEIISSKGYIYHTHFLPHDAAHQRLGDFNKSTLEMLQELLPGHNFEIVPRITQLQTGIQMTRKLLKNAWFDETRCKLGIQRIEGYKKKFSKQDNRFIDQPNKANGCWEGADALRQHAQAKEVGLLGELVFTQSDTTSGIGHDIATQSSNHGYREAPAPDWRM